MAVLILNSAHSKYPRGSDDWVRATVEAVRRLRSSGETMLCSTDPSPWDLATYLAGNLGMNVKLIVKSGGNEAGVREFESLLDEFALDGRRTTPLYLGSTGSARTKAVWRVRDRYAFESARVVYPISIRPGGRLEALLGEYGNRVEVRGDFRIDWKTGEHREPYDFSESTVNPLPRGNWLVHWTRASQGAWPGEKAWEFWHDLLARPHTYVRSALDTLVRILSERRIRGTSRRFPGKRRAVSLTSLDAGGAIALMRWRKRFVRYTFEPYGIGIRRNVLEDMGARRVRYEKPAGDVPDTERLFVQSPGTRGDWSREREWRMHGDIPLDEMNPGDFIAVVPDGDAAEALRSRSKGDFPIHVLFGNVRSR